MRVMCVCVWVNVSGSELAMPDTKVNSRAGHKTLRVQQGLGRVGVAWWQVTGKVNLIQSALSISMTAKR